MSARGLTFNGQHTTNRARPRRHWGVSEKSAKTIGIHCVSCMGAFGSGSRFPKWAHGYRKSMKNPYETKQIQ